MEVTFFKTYRKLAKTNQTGFTLLEALVTIGLTIIILSVFTSLLTATFYLSRTQYGLQATGFIQEELDVLRTLNYDDLILRDSGNLLGLAFTRGDWTVEDDGGNHLLRLNSTVTPLLNETGLTILPGNYRNDFSFSTDVRARTTSANGWSVGLVFRYQDAENHYRFRFSSNGMALDKIYHGEVTTLWSQGAAFAKEIWYTLTVEATGDEINLKKNGIAIGSVSDITFTTGELGLIAINNAQPDFDDIITSDAYSNDTWNFETDQPGQLPNDWKRLSPFDLPSGQAELTITNYLEQPNMKEVNVIISWNDGTTVKSVSGTSVISN